MYVSQFLGQGGDIVSWLVWLVFFMVFFMFYPRIMLSQIMWKLEGTAKRLEGMSVQSKKMLLGEISKKPGKVLKDSIERFFEFFIISPVGLDPYGMVSKVDHLVKNEHDRFRYFVNQIAPALDAERKANIEMGFAGGIELHMIAKIVRHYVELIKKTKSYQIAMLIQMQLPIVERMAKALLKGTKSLAKGEPIGDGVGPWVIANLAGKNKYREIAEGIVVTQSAIEGRKAFLLRAKGPGGRTGYPGKAVEKILKGRKIARIITIDAAAKFEGEKTGSVAEGVGVAMGGPGVERSYIEDAAVRHDIPIDSIIVKMSAEEAIQPMRKSMTDSLPRVREAISRSISRTGKKDKVIVVGVGNASGVGVTKAEADRTVEWVKAYERKQAAKKKKKD